MKKYLKIIPVFFLCLVCFSCASKQVEKSYVDIEGNPDLIKKISLEIVDLINQEKSINTTINLVYDFGDVLGDEILEELKRRGFPLSETDGVTTTFVVRSHDFNKIYLSVSLDKLVMSRIFIYEEQTGKIIPGTPLSKGEV